jgi:[acyl-carrier-protein] S-malonyltransferase
MTVAFVFPGQGTQRVGMGQTLHTQYPSARDIFTAANELVGFELDAMCFRGDPKTLRNTRVAQVAIFVVNAAATAALRESGYDADLAAGHSVGEISALYAAHVFDLPQALDLVTERARIMSKVTSDGAMVAVAGLDGDVIADVCSSSAALGPLCIGLHNGPRNYVLSGATAAITAAEVECRARGAVTITRLRTQHAFHSELMEPVVEEWREYISGIPIGHATIPVVLNTTGCVARDREDIRAALIDQLVSTVRWHDCINALLGAGADVFVEAGDSKVLSALTRAVDRSVTAVTMSDPRAIRRLGHLAAAGVGGRANPRD